MSANKNILIVVKSYKQYTDVLKYLYHYFVKKDKGQGFFDDQMKNHVNSIKESDRRMTAMNIDVNHCFRQETEGNEKIAPVKKIDCNKNIIELHLLNKLSILLQ